MQTIFTYYKHHKEKPSDTLQEMNTRSERCGLLMIIMNLFIPRRAMHLRFTHCKHNSNDLKDFFL